MFAKMDKFQLVFTLGIVKSNLTMRYFI